MDFDAAKKIADARREANKRSNEAEKSALVDRYSDIINREYKPFISWLSSKLKPHLERCKRYDDWAYSRRHAGKPLSDRPEIYDGQLFYTSEKFYIVIILYDGYLLNLGRNTNGRSFAKITFFDRGWNKEYVKKYIEDTSIEPILQQVIEYLSVDLDVLS